MLVLAHLSDIHLDGHPRSADRTRPSHGLPARPSSDRSTPYSSPATSPTTVGRRVRARRQALRSRHPVVVCPGNHDVRDAYRHGLLGDAGPRGRPYPRPVDVAGAVLLRLRLVRSRRAHGLLDDSTLAWLDDLLTVGPRRRTGPRRLPPPAGPVAPPRRRLDPPARRRAARRAGRAPPARDRRASGHAHTATATTFAGRPVLVAPGVVSTPPAALGGRGSARQPDRPARRRLPRAR